MSVQGAMAIAYAVGLFSWPVMVWLYHTIDGFAVDRCAARTADALVMPEPEVVLVQEEALIEIGARALYENWVAEDFANEYLPWADLPDKETWRDRVRAIADAL